jgi:hypothetical protein
MRQWVLVLLVAAGPAWGQSEKEVQAAVGKELDAYTLCLKQHAHDLAKKSDDAEGVIVGKAIAECADERQVLLEASQQPPLNLSVSDANDQINQMVLSLQDRMIRTIHEARGA